MQAESTQLAHITDNFEDPLNLFEKWLQEAENNDYLGMVRVMNIATVDRKYGVLNRNVMLRKFDETGFVFVTERNSRKYEDMKEDPMVAATFFWTYKLNGVVMIRQIRVNGKVSELPSEEIRKYYAEEQLFSKIRCKICVCGEPCDWDDLKRKHDTMEENFNKGTEKLEQNEIYTALKIQPELIDFYFSMPNSIADRIVYTKDPTGKWSHGHVCA